MLHNSITAAMCAMLLAIGCMPTYGQKPNVIVILADDLGWADLPMYGNTFNEAPNLNRLAKRGMTFSNAYAAAPVCSPTRASIMSGQYPARVGVIDFIPGHWRPYEKVIVPKNKTQFLPAAVTTIGEMMEAAGYTNGYFGKWHLGFQKGHHPLDQGFEEAYCADGGFYNPKFTPAITPPPQGRFSDIITDMGVDFIRRNSDNPFFLFLGHYDVHVQLNADTALIKKYLGKAPADGYPSNAVYAAMITHLDNSVGRVMNTLDSLGISDNTMIIFYSDNGGLHRRFDEIPLIDKAVEHFYDGDSLQYVASSNAPLRDEKGSLYEGGIRVPLIISWPKKVRPGTKSEAMVTSPDLYATLGDVAGTPLPAKQVTDGISLTHTLLTGKKPADRPLFWHYPVYHHSAPASAVRKGDWKLIEWYENNSVELYNLKKDIGETRNLAEKRKGKAAELRSLLHEWRLAVGAELPVNNPAFDPAKRRQWGKHPDRK
ncbi:sulfatase [Parapedobacter sp. 10938]|uniref:sulfatase n=1 Tax=Parapedobacter flavus TaxID=3110225 RepID=UPI002DB75199|nr:sulfatase [Parapedobacter sp. 10938]MEC3879168.1 sulfatase [Parapedobacter sp. 10938]